MDTCIRSDIHKKIIKQHGFDMDKGLFMKMLNDIAEKDFKEHCAAVWEDK